LQKFEKSFTRSWETLRQRYYVSADEESDQDPQRIAGTGHTSPEQDKTNCWDRGFHKVVANHGNSFP